MNKKLEQLTKKVKWKIRVTHGKKYRKQIMVWFVANLNVSTSKTGKIN